MHVEVKVSVWKRIELPEGVSKEQIIETLKLGEEGINDLFDTYENLEYNEVYNSEETLTPSDNNGLRTIELYNNAENAYGPIWTNEPIVAIEEPWQQSWIQFLGNETEHIFSIQYAIASGKLSESDYNKLHGEWYGLYGKKGFNKTFNVNNIFNTSKK